MAARHFELMLGGMCALRPIRHSRAWLAGTMLITLASHVMLAGCNAQHPSRPPPLAASLPPPDSAHRQRTTPSSAADTEQQLKQLLTTVAARIQEQAATPPHSNAMQLQQATTLLVQADRAASQGDITKAQELARKAETLLH